MKPAVAISAPNRNSQNENAFSRGNATSGAPICSGSTRLANPNTIGRRVEQQHDRAVHGEQLVELLVGQELQARQGELGAHEQRHQAADEEEGEAGDAVHDADHLVIGRGHQLVDQVALGTEPRRERTPCLEFSDWGRFGYQQILQ